MDLIFCSNVLMYFAPFQMSKVIRGLHHSLLDGGWLAVSPSEASHALFAQFVSVSFPGAILYQKSNGSGELPRTKQRWTPAPLSEIGFVASTIETRSPWTSPAEAAVPTEPVSVAPPGKPALVAAPLNPSAVAELLYQQGCYAEAANTLEVSFARHTPNPREFSLLARALANQGRL